MKHGAQRHGTPAQGRKEGNTMKQYKINQYTKRQYDARIDAQIERDELTFEENTITIVWSEKAVSLDIQATGKRIVPILRKIEASMTAAGLAGDTGIYAGWFGSWADSLRDNFDKKYFIWSYDGRQDRENGHWSYSWGIEQLDADLWYIFLNLALPEGYEVPDDVQIVRDRIEARKPVSAWGKGVTGYAVDMLDELRQGIRDGWIDADVLDSPKLTERALLNGAADWHEYAWGGCGLVYDGDIARALCSPSELKRTDNGRKAPNNREQWPDVEARARFQAARLILEAARV